MLQFIKQHKLPFIWVVFGACVWILGIILFYTTGSFTFRYCSWAADNEGCIYVGKDSNITVYSPEGVVLRTISTDTSSQYRFTIVDEELCLEKDRVLYTMDLNGNKLGTVPHADINTYIKLHFNSRRFTTSDGALYIMAKPFFRPTIYHIVNGSAVKVFQMPWHEYIMRLFVLAYFISGFIIIPVELIRTTKNNRKSKQ